MQKTIIRQFELPEPIRNINRSRRAFRLKQIVDAILDEFSQFIGFTSDCRGIISESAEKYGTKPFVLGLPLAIYSESDHWNHPDVHRMQTFLVIGGLITLTNELLSEETLIQQEREDVYRFETFLIDAAFSMVDEFNPVGVRNELAKATLTRSFQCQKHFTCFETSLNSAILLGILPKNGGLGFIADLAIAKSAAMIGSTVALLVIRTDYDPEILLECAKSINLAAQLSDDILDIHEDIGSSEFNSVISLIGVTAFEAFGSSLISRSDISIDPNIILGRMHYEQTIAEKFIKLLPQNSSIYLFFNKYLQNLWDMVWNQVDFMGLSSIKPEFSRLCSSRLLLSCLDENPNKIDVSYFRLNK